MVAISQNKNGKDENIFQEFYIATKYKNKNNEFIVYSSEPFKLSEIDIINLIKICILEARSKSIGKRILAIYEDSTQERKEVTKQRLKYIGIDNEKEKPTSARTKNPTIR